MFSLSIETVFPILIQDKYSKTRTIFQIQGISLQFLSNFNFSINVNVDENTTKTAANN